MYNELPHYSKIHGEVNMIAAILRKCRPSGTPPSHSGQQPAAKGLQYWLNANKILLNVRKAEMVIFKSKRKKFNDIVKIN